MRRILSALMIVSAFVFVGASVPARAQTYTQSVVYGFCNVGGSVCPDGVDPQSLIQAADGSFYGLAFSRNGCTTTCTEVFKITPEGAFALLHANIQGFPGGLVQGSDGNIYGTAGAFNSVGVNAYGSIFKLTPSGVFTTLYSFTELYAAGTNADLIQGSDGNFYGTAGEYNSSQPGGAVYRITPSGTISNLYVFCIEDQQGYCPDGSFPEGLVQGSDGNFYGTTNTGGSQDSNAGTVFKLTQSGNLTTLYTFCSQGGTGCADGESPTGQLVQASDGNFYGTTANGGLGEGTIFKITPGGMLTTLYAFCPGGGPCSDGVSPNGLVLGSDGGLYGTTGAYGSGGVSTVFRITTAGNFKILSTFCTPNCSGGSYLNSITQGSDGGFYGTTESGGASAAGVVFKIASTPTLAAPVAVSLSESSIEVGDSVTLNWQVLNAFSTTMQQCIAFAPFNSGGAGTWTGLQSGTLAGGVYSGTATIKPTAAGVYAYALTCGGVESGQATLNVGGAKSETGTSLLTNSPAYVDSLVTLSAAVFPEPSAGSPPTGSVTFSVGSESLGSVQLMNGTASLDLDASGIAAGTYPVTATYSGDVTYKGSSAATSVLLQRYATFTGLTITPTTVVQGQSVTLSSTIATNGVSGAPSGTVTFYYGGQSLGAVKPKSGVASLTVTPDTSIPPGTYSVTAIYSGDAVHLPSTSSAVTVTLQAATTTKLTVTPTTVASGQSVTFASTVSRAGGGGTASGTVSFYAEGTLLLGTVPISMGNASLTLVNNGSGGLPLGTFAVMAEYSGDPLDEISASTPITMTVETPGNATTTTLSVMPTMVTQGQSVTISTTVGRNNGGGTPTGTVTFFAGTLAVGSVTLSSGSGSLTVPVTGSTASGVYAVTAQYNGDASDSTSTSAAVSVTVIAPTTTKLTVSPNPVPANQIVTMTAFVKQTYGSATPTGTVTFTVGSFVAGTANLVNGTAVVNLSTVGISAGTYAVTATYNGDMHDTESSDTLSVVVK
jgi:uncharacterized repeat protein (TIGR03803 family)